MNTRRFPRTMEQAFGPYARGPVQPMREPAKTPAAYWALYVVAMLVLFIAGSVR